MTGMPYPDVELALVLLLERDIGVLAASGTGPDGGPQLHVDTETPPDLAARLPFVRVALITGTDDGVTDRSIIDVDVFHVGRQEGYDLAETIRARLSGTSHRIDQVILDRVETEEKPRQLPWADEAVRRFGATYRVSARR